MRNKIHKLVTNPLIINSGIVFVGTTIGNGFNYLFYIIMGNLLVDSELGLLTALISLVALFGIFQTTLVGVIAKFTTVYNAKNDRNIFNSFLSYSLKFVFIISFSVFIVLLLLTSFVKSYLHVTDTFYVLYIFIIILFTIFTSLTIGVLQGQLRFYLLSFINAIGPILKNIFAVVLIATGFKLGGILFGIVLSTIIPFILSFYYIFKNHQKNSVSGVDESLIFKEFKGYSLTFFLATLGLMVLTYADVILVRHFFNAEVSGQYARIALVGKSIFYLASPIYFVFFPLISHKKEKKESLYSTLLLAGGGIGLLSLFFSSLYFAIPNVILKIFFPARELSNIAPYLGIYSIFIILLSLVSLSSNYFLSISRTGIYKLNILAGLLFIILLYMNHSSIYDVIYILIIVTFLLLFSHGVYYLMHGRH